MLSILGGKILAEELVYWERNKCHLEHVVFNVPVGCPNGDIWQLYVYGLGYRRGI